MQSFDFDGTTLTARLNESMFPGKSILPANSWILHCTPFTAGEMAAWDQFFSACAHLASNCVPADFVFVDAAWDPIQISNNQICDYVDRLQQIFGGKKVCVLSSRAQHWFDNIPNCVFFPLFLMIPYPPVKHSLRQGRFGCLNRRNADHRVRLMTQLLEQGLLSSEQDVYSVALTSVHDPKTIGDTVCIFGKTWPSRIATHPDNFPNDYSIDHPAWHTGIAIVTETLVDENSLFTEKTAKSILSKSCFSIYIGKPAYAVLEQLGFLPRFFSEHAHDHNIDPILELCKNIRNANQAIEYRQQHIDKIDHNYHWFDFGQESVIQRPWWPLYQPKLQQALDSL